MAGAKVSRQQIAGSHVLRREDSIHSFQGKLAPAAQEIGKMRLSESRLTRQERNANRASLYPAQQFHAQTLVHLSKIHLWKFRHEQCRRGPVFSTGKLNEAELPPFSGFTARLER